MTPIQECVICGTIYISEKDSNGWDRLVPANLAVLEQVQNDRTLAPASVPEAAASGSWSKGKTTAHDEVPRVDKIGEFVVSLL